MRLEWRARASQIDRQIERRTTTAAAVVVAVARRPVAVPVRAAGVLWRPTQLCVRVPLCCAALWLWLLPLGLPAASCWPTVGGGAASGAGAWPPNQPIGLHTNVLARAHTHTHNLIAVVLRIARALVLEVAPV